MAQKLERYVAATFFVLSQDIQYVGRLAFNSPSFCVTHYEQFSESDCHRPMRRAMAAIDLDGLRNAHLSNINRVLDFLCPQVRHFDKYMAV